MDCGLAGVAKTLRASDRGDPCPPLVNFYKGPQKIGASEKPWAASDGDAIVMEGTAASLQRPTVPMPFKDHTAKAMRWALWHLEIRHLSGGGGRPHDRPRVPSGRAQVCEGRARDTAGQCHRCGSHNFREAALLIHETAMDSKL